MTTSETVAIIAIVLFYIVVAFIVSAFAYKELNENQPYMFFAQDKTVHKDDIEYLKTHKSLIAFIIGALWMLAFVFKLGSDIGGWIYEDIIIKGNDENRIASWFV